jgi:hypothetical protein
MRRVIVTMLSVALLHGAALTGTAFADVHAVSQAGCGNSANAGATQSRDRGGRPDAPIPVDASDGNTRGRGGAADAEGQHC